MKNALYKAIDVKKACSRKLQIDFKARKTHNNGWFCFEGKRVARITVPHGRKGLKTKTYVSMAKQLKITTDQFDGLLDCSFGRKEYLCHLEQERVI